MTILTYNGKKINQRNSDGYVNATQMCQANVKNAKKVSHWLENKETQDYIEGISTVTGIPATDLISITQGGDSKKQGTWIHPKLAICLGRWISVPFAIWCDEHIRTLIETGSTKLETQQDAEWLGKRTQGKKARRDFTDAIDAYKARHKEELSVNALKWMYPNASDAINLGLCGKKASALAELLKCNKDDIRNNLSRKELTTYLAVEEMSAWLIESQDMDPLLAVKEVISKNYYFHRFADKYKQLAQGKTPPALTD